MKFLQYSRPYLRFHELAYTNSEGELHKIFMVPSRANFLNMKLIRGDDDSRDDSDDSYVKAATIATL